MDEIQIANAITAGIMAAMKSPVKRAYVSPTATLTGEASPFGCCNFFDKCGDGDLMSLYYAGRLPLLDWLGFNVGTECYRTVEFITYLRPERHLNGTPTEGYLSNACADPAGVEWGSCKITVEDFGLVGRHGPTRKIMQPKKYCVTSPTYRLDGSVVSDEREWDMKFVGDQIIADMNNLVVTGNASVGGQFNGLQAWVKTGYQSDGHLCQMLDSIVIDWKGLDMDGGAGITWNGNAIGASFNFIDVLLAVYRRFRQRIMWSAALRTSKPKVGDMILVLPSSMIDCLLKHFTCWSVCDGGQYNEVFLQKYEARQFYQGLLGGMFGDGQIILDGYAIPILGYDWSLINGPTTGDIYFLTSQIGSFRIWEGEFLDADEAARKFGGSGYTSSDGGRVIWKVETANLCTEMKGWINPRLFCKAPWLQARFQDVKCVTPGGFMSVDPDDTSFFPLTSFNPAECPS